MLERAEMAEKVAMILEGESGLAPTYVTVVSIACLSFPGVNLSWSSSLMYS